MSNSPIANVDTPDPWVIASPLQPDTFYLTFTLGNRIEIWSSNSLESFHDARKAVIWHPPPGSPWSADIWAPELHFFFGAWYIYAAGAPPEIGNPGHRTIVLRCASNDPLDSSSWIFEGPLKGLPHDQWSIDATVLSPDPGLSAQLPNGRAGLPDDRRRWYVCYSGWPLGDHSDTQQDLFLAPLKSPLEADSSSLVCISCAELPWERPDGGRRGVNEGPAYVDFSHQRGNGWRGIVYSAHGSWTCEYKLALLTYIGAPQDDMCNPSLWRKRPTPLLVSDKAMGSPFGPGHASFVNSPYNDGRVFCVYHGTERDDEGWENRKGRVLCMGEEAFREDARTMCCAYSVCPGMQGHQGVQTGQSVQAPGQNTYPGQQTPAPHQSASAQGGKGGFDKYIGEIEKRIPAQYQGYFSKAKTFFK